MPPNGSPQEFHYCAYNDSHKFLTLNQKYEHEPSCPDNPKRVNERDNPERT